MDLILQLVNTAGSAAAIEALPLVTRTPRLCASLIRALQQRRNARGIHAVLQHARLTGLASGPQGREVWRAAIVALGTLGQAQAARRTFVLMREAGAWERGDTVTVNLLLNALHRDIRLQYIR
jgi:hypothetical protein